MTIEVQKFKKAKHGVTGDFTKAHLEIYGIDHFRPSYDVLVFLNDSRVGPKNATETRKGYAGRFSVFGHATCYSDACRCAVGK
ncbi:MAG: hypothetical protein AAGH68_08155 [Pseudomonadota bacterium]